MRLPRYRKKENGLKVGASLSVPDLYSRINETKVPTSIFTFNLTV
jgi:hypothetical protein